MCALEVFPGVLLRINADSTPAHFSSATSELNVLESCAHLVSIIVSNRGVEKTSLELLASNVESALKQNHLQSHGHKGQ